MLADSVSLGHRLQRRVSAVWRDRATDHDAATALDWNAGRRQRSVDPRLPMRSSVVLGRPRCGVREKAEGFRRWRREVSDEPFRR